MQEFKARQDTGFIVPGGRNDPILHTFRKICDALVRVNGGGFFQCTKNCYLPSNLSELGDFLSKPLLNVMALIALWSSMNFRCIDLIFCVRISSNGS